MITLQKLNSWAEWPPLTPAPKVQIEPNGALLYHPADACWVAIDGRSALARCSLWFESAGRLDGFRRPGAIGHFASADATASEALLQRAVEQLRGAGCDAAVGPLDQNTWHRYRFITERGSEPVFTMEPDNDDAWPGHFRSAGFQTLATYCSYLVEDLTCESKKLVHVAER
ncbi:MAG: hypothetical protein R3236_01990, partial [Phycisphaeraceae bacterium]|nr:hypothetical protein [Phycisphaeraceae bacterium]